MYEEAIKCLLNLLFKGLVENYLFRHICEKRLNFTNELFLTINNSVL